MYDFLDPARLPAFTAGESVTGEKLRSYKVISKYEQVGIDMIYEMKNGVNNF